MKPIISLLLSAVLCLCLVGCAGEKAPPPEGDVLFDENGVLVIALEPESEYLEKIDENRWVLSVYIENNTKDNVDVMMSRCYVNDVNMGSGFSVFDLSRGESRIEKFNIYEYELEEFDFESLGVFTGELSVYYDQDGIDNALGRPFEVAYGEYEPVELETLSLMNEPGFLEFGVYNIYTDEDSGDFVFKPMMVNLSSTDLRVVITDLTLNGNAVAESNYFGKLSASPGLRDYGIMLIDAETLGHLEISQVETIGFRMKIYESFSDFGDPQWETGYAEFAVADMQAALGLA